MSTEPIPTMQFDLDNTSIADLLRKFSSILQSTVEGDSHSIYFDYIMRERLAIIYNGLVLLASYASSEGI